MARCGASELALAPEAWPRCPADRNHTAPANLEAWLRAPIVPRGTSFHRSVNAAGEYVEGSLKIIRRLLQLRQNASVFAQGCAVLHEFFQRARSFQARIVKTDEI